MKNRPFAEPTNPDQLLEIEPQLRIAFGCVAVLLVKKTGLYVATPLVFGAGVFLDVAANLMVENLADSQSCIDSNGLDCKHLDSPVAAIANVAKASCHVDE
jgi:hypothetical protein